MKEDTIAAIASPIVEGAIGVIRISGDEAEDVLNRVFCPVRKHISSGHEADTGSNGENEIPASEKVDFSPIAVSETTGLPLENRRMSYGHIADPESGKIVDEVLAVIMRAPYTYTREDVAEIYCHGSVVALRKTFSLVLACGARLAEPGEFTKRAFLNGRLDLSQAEAVIDLIRAKTDDGFDTAMSQLSGALSNKVRELRGSLVDVLVDLTVNIDYPDEDIEEITYEKLLMSLSQIDDKVVKLLAGAGAGRILKEGLRVAIIGKPNVGKSSLMNVLLKESRAIVTEIPGTTRDTIEETVNIRGIPVVLTDTAGIRETEDMIEKIGIARSKAAANEADLVILMLDGSSDLEDEDREIIEKLTDRRIIAVLNKRDRSTKLTATELSELLPQAVIVEAAVAAERGIDEIEDAISSLVYEGGVRPGEGVLVTSARHEDILRRTHKLLSDAVSATEIGEPLDIIEIDVHEAYMILGEIIGESVTDDIIDEVFSRFCLGK